jgi:hypothetical protein
MVVRNPVTQKAKEKARQMTPDAEGTSPLIWHKPTTEVETALPYVRVLPIALPMPQRKPFQGRGNVPQGDLMFKKSRPQSYWSMFDSVTQRTRIQTKLSPSDQQTKFLYPAGIMGSTYPPSTSHLIDRVPGKNKVWQDRYLGVGQDEHQLVLFTEQALRG